MFILSLTIWIFMGILHCNHYLQLNEKLKAIVCPVNATCEKLNATSTVLQIKNQAEDRRTVG